MHLIKLVCHAYVSFICTTTHTHTPHVNSYLGLRLPGVFMYLGLLVLSPQHFATVMPRLMTSPERLTRELQRLTVRTPRIPINALSVCVHVYVYGQATFPKSVIKVLP